MNVTLKVNGRDMTFSKEELTTIVEDYLTRNKVSMAEVPKKPTVGEWFKVKPLSIDQRLFRERREDESQEETRQLIVEAFEQLEANPQKYRKNFKTLIPSKKWAYASVADLKDLACHDGDHNADWVEQALEWAQRITNGESWKAVCNDIDTTEWYRAVVWKNGMIRIIGGSDADCSFDTPASNLGSICNDKCILNTTVPLIASYDE